MTTPQDVDEVCPFSDPPYGEFTDDHIFPQFLGGRKTVRICRTCNSRFGHSFEGRASDQLKRLQVFISHFGLDLSRNPATWPSAFVIGEAIYSLKSGPQGAQYELAQPIVRRDESGKIIGGRARSWTEAKKTAASLLRKGKAKQIEIEESAGENLDDVKLTVDLSYNADLFRLSAKIASNAAVLLGRGSLIRGSNIGRYLSGTDEWGARIACCDTSAIRGLRPPLSHTVYLEFGVQSHAVVILFGSLQVYVPLPTAPPGAAVGFLDPITGEEFFDQVAPIGIAPPPKFVSHEELVLHIQYTGRQLGDEALARGALHPPDLRMGLDSVAPSFGWVDGTHRFYRKL